MNNPIEDKHARVFVPHVPCGIVELYSRSKDHNTISQVKGFNSWVYSVTFSTSKAKAGHFQQEVGSCLQGKDKGNIADKMGVDKRIL